MSAIMALCTSLWIGVATHLWQTTLVLVPIMLLGKVLRGAPARAPELLWQVALLKILLPVTAIGTLRSRLLASVPGTWGDSTPQLLTAFDAVSTVFDPARGLQHGIAGLPASVGIVAVVLTAAWTAGVLWTLAALLRDATRVRKSSLASAAALDAAERLILEQAAGRAGVDPKHIDITEDASAPHVAGWWRPRILVSRLWIARLATDELAAILAHEAAHRRRRDPLRLVSYRLIAAILGFYPPLRVVLARLCESAEFACDEAALRTGIGTARYSAALARVLWNTSLAPTAALSSPAARSPLQRRFEHLSSGGFAMLNRDRLALVVAIGLVAAVSLTPLSPAGSAGNGEDDLILPKIIDSSFVSPTYPPAERHGGVEGLVYLEVQVMADGSVGSCAVQKGVEQHPALGEAALIAVRSWRFEPGTRDGKPVDCQVVIPVQFKLAQEKGTSTQER